MGRRTRRKCDWRWPPNVFPSAKDRAAAGRNDRGSAKRDPTSGDSLRSRVAPTRTETPRSRPPRADHRRQSSHERLAPWRSARSRAAIPDAARVRRRSISRRRATRSPRPRIAPAHAGCGPNRRRRTRCLQRVRREPSTRSAGVRPPWPCRRVRTPKWRPAAPFGGCAMRHPL